MVKDQRPPATPKFCSAPRPRRGRYFLAPRDPGDPATLPTLAGGGGSDGSAAQRLAGGRRRPRRRRTAISRARCGGRRACTRPSGARARGGGTGSLLQARSDRFQVCRAGHPVVCVAPPPTQAGPHSPTQARIVSAGRPGRVGPGLARTRRRGKLELEFERLLVKEKGPAGSL